MILIVDGDADNGRTLCRALAGRGGALATHHCSHPRDALQILQEHRPSLLVLVLRSRDDDGLGVLEALRGRPETADVPVVVHTASDCPEDRRRAESLGVSGYVIKGLGTTVQLLAVVEAALAAVI